MRLQNAVIALVISLSFISESKAQLGVHQLQLNSLLAAELNRIQARVSSEDTVLAVGSELDDAARQAVVDSGMSWIEQSDWPENRGIPPIGVTLFIELRVDGETGVVRVWIGGTADVLACGTRISSTYSWKDTWVLGNRAIQAC